MGWSYPTYLYTINIKGICFLCTRAEKGEKYTKLQLRQNQFFYRFRHFFIRFLGNTLVRNTYWYFWSLKNSGRRSQISNHRITLDGVFPYQFCVNSPWRESCFEKVRPMSGFLFRKLIARWTDTPSETLAEKRKVLLR